MKKISLQILIFAALMVAIGIVLSNFVSISYPPNSTIIRFGIGYLPLIIVSVILGPRVGFVAAIIQDVLGYFVYMMIYGFASGPFFPGFTFNAILYGVLPGLIYNLKINSKKFFLYMNFTLMTIMLALGIWGLIEIDYIIQIIENRLSVDMSFSPWIIYFMLGLGILGVLSGYVFLYFKRNEDDKNQRLIFITIILQVLVTLILTPLWVTILYSSATFLPQLPLRIIKTPLEVFIYSVLLLRLIKVFENYKI
ncbi:MAG: folate family ECF transporter S component [Candidatus Izemoplasmatales bacterium]